MSIVKIKELTFIKDKLEQAKAIAVRGGHIIADDIDDDIHKINADIQEIYDEEKESAAADDKTHQPARNLIDAFAYP